MQKIYLAGPGVFLPDAVDYGARKQAICAAYGFRGLYPLDAQLDLTALSPFDAALAISRANEALMRDSDLAIADMTPYQGVSADCGTSFEIGFMRALGKPVLGYSNVAADLFTRVQAMFGPITGQDPSGRQQIAGMALEDFGMIDNLMLHGAIHHSGFPVVTRDVPPDQRYTSLDAFEAAVALLAGKASS